jgi:hypothetical protein
MSNDSSVLPLLLEIIPIVGAVKLIQLSRSRTSGEIVNCTLQNIRAFTRITVVAAAAGK